MRGNSVLQTFITPLLKKVDGKVIGDYFSEYIHEMLLKNFPVMSYGRWSFPSLRAVRPDECHSGGVEFENNLKKFKKRLDKEFEIC